MSAPTHKITPQPMTAKKPAGLCKKRMALPAPPTTRTTLPTIADCGTL